VAIVAVIGTLTAYTLVRYRFPGRLLVGALVFVPIVVPKTVLGISLVVLTTYLDIPRSLYTVIFGHVLFCFPYVTIVVASVFLRLDQSLIDAAADLGAREWRTARKVILPLIRNGVVAGVFVCFVLSFGEFSLSAFLAGREQTLPLVIYSEFRFKVTPKINALSSLVVAGNILLVILAEYYRSRGAALIARRTADSH
jgi:ABC-type spermidine/putrescine transport system permease subunit II